MKLDGSLPLPQGRVILWLNQFVVVRRIKIAFFFLKFTHLDWKEFAA